MTRDSFQAWLVRLGLPTSMVSFDGPGTGECYAVEHRPTGFVVYYSERGERRDEQTFAMESFALRYLLGRIIDYNAG